VVLTAFMGVVTGPASWDMREIGMHGNIGQDYIGASSKRTRSIRARRCTGVPSWQ
jgi:hypothetical protein